MRRYPAFRRLYSVCLHFGEIERLVLLLERNVTDAIGFGLDDQREFGDHRLMLSRGRGKM